jgi:hypothetical protein
MGGAARNVVSHLLWGEPVTARATYSAVRSRFWSLLWATVIVGLWGLFSLVIAFVGWYSVFAIVIFGSVLLGQVAVYPAIIVGALGLAGATAVVLWLFFFLVGRVAYVPQILLVEGKGVLASLSRSFSLAKGNVRRLMAMTLFISFATYSALMILVVPLGWYGYLNGIDPSPWNSSTWPTWYAIGYSSLQPISSILLTPIWMLGLSLLYVDERVRHEGYDIELLASQRLGPMPELNVSSPLAPAIAVDVSETPLPPRQSGSVLGI